MIMKWLKRLSEKLIARKNVAQLSDTELNEISRCPYQANHEWQIANPYLYENIYNPMHTPDLTVVARDPDLRKRSDFFFGQVTDGLLYKYVCVHCGAKITKGWGYKG